MCPILELGIHSKQLKSNYNVWNRLIGNDRKNDCKCRRDGILRRVYGVTLRDKVRSCKIRKALNFEPLFLQIQKSYLRRFSHVSRTPLEKDWQDTSCGPHPQESGQGPSSVTTSSTLLGLVLVKGVRRSTWDFNLLAFMRDSNAYRQDRHFYQCNGQTTIETLRSIRFTLLLLVLSCLFEALSDCALWACDAMRHHRLLLMAVRYCESS